MPSLENYAEQVEMLILQGQASLTGFSIVRFDEDEQAQKDRIVVKAEPKQIETPSHAPSVPPKSWRIPLSIEIYLVTRDAAEMDAIVQAIATANNSTAPAPALTLANTAFPNGCQIEDTDSGNRSDQPNSRNRTVEYAFIAVN